MPSPTLVVVDMQPHFDAARNPNVVASVTREIIKTILSDGSVIFLEYEGCGPTIPALFDLTKGYRKRSRIQKPDDDGSKEVKSCLKRREFDDNYIRVCGVNAECCVYSTIEGLLKRLPTSKVEVVKDACGWYNNMPNWRDYLRHPNLSLVEGSFL